MFCAAANQTVYLQNPEEEDTERSRLKETFIIIIIIISESERHSEAKLRSLSRTTVCVCFSVCMTDLRSVNGRLQLSAPRRNFRLQHKTKIHLCRLPGAHPAFEMLILECKHTQRHTHTHTHTHRGAGHGPAAGKALRAHL